MATPCWTSQIANNKRGGKTARWNFTISVKRSHSGYKKRSFLTNTGPGVSIVYKSWLGSRWVYLVTQKELHKSETDRAEKVVSQDLVLIPRESKVTSLYDTQSIFNYITLPFTPMVQTRDRYSLHLNLTSPEQPFCSDTTAQRAAVSSMKLRPHAILFKT